MRLATLILLAALAAPAAAQPLPPGAASSPPADAPARHQRMSMQARFDAANTTHDGKLTLDQARAGQMRRVADNFDAIDAKKNGYVTVEDIRAYNRAQRAARRAAKP